MLALLLEGVHLVRRGDRRSVLLRGLLRSWMLLSILSRGHWAAHWVFLHLWFNIVSEIFLGCCGYLYNHIVILPEGTFFRQPAMLVAANCGRETVPPLLVMCINKYICKQKPEEEPF